jgi:hypothetical protein
LSENKTAHQRKPGVSLSYQVQRILPGYEKKKGCLGDKNHYQFFMVDLLVVSESEIILLSNPKRSHT